MNFLRHAIFYEMWCNIYVVGYNIKKFNLKMLTCFGMIWNYDNFSKRNIRSGKIYALSKNNIYSNLIAKKHKTYWGNYKYNK
jgi:hypothetical protein